MLRFFDIYQQKLENLKDKASREETSLMLIKFQTEDLLDETLAFRTTLKGMKAHENLIKKCDIIINQIKHFLYDLEGIIEMKHEHNI